MKLVVVLLFIAVLTVLASNSVSAADCSSWPCSCGDTISGDITMSSDLECDGNGLNIVADELTLDCQNYAIKGNGSASFIGINVTNVTSQVSSLSAITVKNCNVSQFDTGIEFYSTNNSIIQNNTVFNTSTRGIYLHLVSNNTVINNTIEYSKDTLVVDCDDDLLDCAAMSLNSSNSNFIGNNTISNNYEVGIYSRQLNDDPSGNNFSDNTLTNNSPGYLFHSTAGNNYVVGDTISNNLDEGIYVDNYDQLSTQDIYVINTNFTLNFYDVRVSARERNVTIINSSFNRTNISVGSGSRVYVQWYVDINVTDADGSALEGVNINSYDSLSNLVETNISSPTGLSQFTLTEYYRDDNVNYYLVPHTFTATKNNYTENTTSITLLNTSGATSNLSLKEIGCGDSVYHNFYFGNNYSCDDAALIIGSDNIVITGNDYSLTGTGTSTGINISEMDNVTIGDLTIQNFSEGINFYRSNNSNITRVFLFNNTLGIVFNNSNNNSIFDSVSRNNTYDVYADGITETNNSLVNASIGIDNITSIQNASVFVKWYVDVNITYNDGLSLSGGTASAFINSTGELESTTSYRFEVPRLIVSELLKNVSGVSYLTPNNISFIYTTSTQNASNSSVINISETNSTEINLSVILDCVSPAIDYNFSNATNTVCPGTFDVYDMIIDTDNVVVTCDDTEFTGPNGPIYYYDTGLTVTGENVTVEGCTFSRYKKGIYVNEAHNFTLNGTKFKSGAKSVSDAASVYVENSDSGVYKNINSTDNEMSMYFYSSNHMSITTSIFDDGGTALLRLATSENFTITNNTFSSGYYGIWLTNTDLVSIYHNTFNSFSGYIFYSDGINDNSVFNTSVSDYPQGNAYNDYCDKGSDTNSDGYADAVTSIAAADWPYNKSVSDLLNTQIEDGYIGETTSGYITDYGPKIQACVTEVFLGSGGSAGGGGSSSSSAGASAAVATPATPSTAQKRTSTNIYTATEAKEFIKQEITTQTTDERTTEVVVTLENTGDQIMNLFPDLSQESNDPFYIVTKKTTGYKDSLFSRMAGMSYSDDSVAGRLLEARILNPEEIILQPGEKIEQVLQIEAGLVAPREIRIQFTTLGEVVSEQEVEIEEESVSGTAIDVDQDNSLIDMYAIIAPAEFYERILEEASSNSITGGAITDFFSQKNEYLLEVNINRGKTTLFSDLYGPYTIKEAQTFIFAQQLEYDPEFYVGNVSIVTKIFHNGKEIVENEFPLVLR